MKYRYLFISVVYITQKNIPEYFCTNTTFINGLSLTFSKRKNNSKRKEKKCVKNLRLIFFSFSYTSPVNMIDWIVNKETIKFS